MGWLAAMYLAMYLAAQKICFTAWPLAEPLHVWAAHRFTEADLRLYPTIIRYDSVYTTLFKCARRRVSDYPALERWRRDVYNLRTPSSSLQVAAPF